MYLPSTRGHIDHGAIEHVGSGREEDEGQEDARREQRVEEEHGDDGIAAQRLLLAHIIKAKQRGREKG